MLLLNKGQLFCAISIQLFTLLKCEEYKLEIRSNGPIVRGGTLHFVAVLYSGEKLASGTFEYSWSDNAMPSHSKQVTSDFPIVTWDVTYGPEYPPGWYEAQVIVQKKFFVIPYEITSARISYKLSDTLNGRLLLAQKNVTRSTEYISTADALIQKVNLTEPDAKFISTATTVTTFWFIDCIYYGPSNNGEFSHIFPVSGEEHTIDALMVADFNPPPPPVTTTTTTTTTPTPTTTKSTTTATTTKPSNITTTSKPTTSVTLKSANPTTTNKVPTSISRLPSNVTPTKSIFSPSKLGVLQKRSVAGYNTTEGKTQRIMMNINGTLIPYNGTFPYICNGTVALGDKKSYGYFSRKIVAKAPVSSVNVTGNNWLQHGDMLALNVLCDGAPSLRYCVQFKKGSHNATGNETCANYLTLETCSFLIERYLGDSAQHTVIIIIENDVTKVVKSVAITIYEAKKQAQLSVIVVPVAFSLVAVVLIVFGVAYYIQNRKRFIIEVADFNFGVDYTDMEYKTFRERLQESFVNAFTRAPTPEPVEVPNWSLGPSQKYGSMT